MLALLLIGDALPLLLLLLDILRNACNMVCNILCVLHVNVAVLIHKAFAYDESSSTERNRLMLLYQQSEDFV
jgi:hypothetical protein